MSSVRDYLSPDPLMFVTDLTREKGGGSDGRRARNNGSGSARGSGARGSGQAVVSRQSEARARGSAPPQARSGVLVAAPVPPPSIYERVRAQKRKLEAEKDQCSTMRERIEALENEKASCTERFRMRRRRELQEEIDQVRKELHAVESGEKIKNFVDETGPYLRAFQRQQFCRPQQLAPTTGGASTTLSSTSCEEGSRAQQEADDGSRGQQQLFVSMVGGAPRQVPALPPPGACPAPVLPAPGSTGAGTSSTPHIVRGHTSVVDEYAVAFEGAAPPYDIEAKDTCKACGEPVQLHTGLSMLVCVKCGTAQPFLDATASLLSFSDDSYDYASFSYKRINHFVEWVSAMQAKETTEIPQPVLDSVMERLADERVRNSDEITVHKVRDVLKKLKLRKYYEHTQLITCKVTGRAPPRMTPTQEERIKLLFMAASTAFQQLCPPDRSNFLSYNFVLFKFAELLGYDSFLPNFALLRGPAKLRRQDEIYKMLCEALDWEFIPSIGA